ncbi:NnrS protein involved in response to NO [Rubrivivax sp. A210]|uniref:NnrS family protein n=1 Tax=Rubrivivax sp. A210 TaxID=2772301 RepID=UPI00191B2045|nr:NnrS family protein [Rubrivivax sp. A210]CAD5369691.1 NnrS protein involved in response to NO [Rubrivivax sp. A210]
METLLRIEEPGARPLRRFALWDLGFRPFYLLASTFAALSIPLWALQVSGLLGQAYLAGPLWHAHEMLFGFTLAVIVGFLFTAGRNWSNQPTPTGPALAALAALWLAARVLVLTPWALAAALANIAFPLAAAAALAVPFVRAGNRRNYFFVALLVLLGLASGAVHLSQLGLASLPAWAGIQLALDIVLFVMSVMGGRVIPMFTNNGVPGAGATRHPLVEKAALGGVLALLLADLAGLRGPALGALALAVAAAHAARWALWRPWRTLQAPLVWVLHLAYLWIALHLLLRGAAGFGILAESAASHALTVGAAGGLIIGMMTRTARGHTARPLRADRWEIAAFVLVALAAVVRVALPLLAPLTTLLAVQASAALWSAGFGVYALRYWSVLTRPRLDGKPG